MDLLRLVGGTRYLDWRCVRSIFEVFEGSWLDGEVLIEEVGLLGGIRCPPFLYSII